MRNVIFITLDALRYDKLGIYGNKENLTPTLDAFARTSLVFNSCFSVSNTSAPSHTSLLSGCYPVTHGVRRNGWKIPDSVILVSEIFKKNGYATVGAVSQEMLSSTYQFNKGFDTFFDNSPYDRMMSLFSHLGTQRYNLRKLLQNVFRIDTHSRDGENTLKDVTRWLHQHHERPFFLFLHLFDLHRDSYSRRTGKKSPDLHERYNHNVELLDFFLKQLFTTLQDLHLFDDTIIAILADHGQCLGEDNITFHGWSLKDLEMKVPFLLYVPGMKHRFVDSFCRTLDVVPTLLELAGLRSSLPFDGKSLTPLLKQDKPLSSEVFMEGCLTYLDIKGIRTPEWKYVLKNNHDEYFYNMRKDPSEITNLFKKNPKEAARFKAQLLAHFSGKEHHQETDEHTKAMLRKLGYLE